MTQSASGTDMRGLLAAVGEVLLCWGYIENAILDRLGAIGHPAGKYPKVSVLSQWKRTETPTAEMTMLIGEVERLASIRNSLAHGLASASIDPMDARGAAVVCRTPSGEQRIAFATLIETRNSLFRLSHAIRSLPAVHCGP